jgi:hypothetical protein
MTGNGPLRCAAFSRTHTYASKCYSRSIAAFKLLITSVALTIIDAPQRACTACFARQACRRENAPKRPDFGMEPVAALHSSDRNAALLQIVEDAKSNHPSLCLEAFGQLFRSNDSAAQLNGLSLLRHVIANKWNRLESQQQTSVVQHLYQVLRTADFQAIGAPVRTQFAYALSDVTMVAGQDATEFLLKTSLVELVQKGMHSTISSALHLRSVCVVLQPGRDAYDVCVRSRKHAWLLACRRVCCHGGEQSVAVPQRGAGRRQHASKA